MHNPVLVIGGSGFIGGHLVRLLVASGHRVTVASRNAGRSDSPDVTCERVDVADAAAVQRLTAGARIVFHLASGGGAQWSDFVRDFIHGARNIAEACLANGVERLVYTSSTAALYLGDKRNLDEAAGPDPQPESRAMYGRAKVETERVLNAMHRSRGLPVVILRPAVVVGPGGMANHSGTGYWPIDTCCIGWNAGNNPIPFVLVSDVARALLAAMETPGIEGMVFNLAGDVRPSAREYVKLLADGSRRNIRFYPQSLLKLQAIEIFKWLMKLVARKPENAFPSYRDLKSRGMVAQLDCSAAKRVLGWQPNASFEVFYREAIQSAFAPIAVGDLRFAPANLRR